MRFAHCLADSFNDIYSHNPIFTSLVTSLETKHGQPLVCASTKDICNPSNKDGNTYMSTAERIF